MKRLSYRIILAMLILLVYSTCSSIAVDRTALWSAYNKAVNKGRPKTAIRFLNQIMEITLKQKRYSEWMKALTKKIVLEANIQGNKPEEKVKRLKKLIKQAPPETKFLLQTILAKWYWHYYSRNKWRFMQRTRTGGGVSEDFTTWDLPRIFSEIDKLFTEVLKHQDKLKKISVEEFSDFLVMGTAPITLRPTLFDFIAYEALQFYKRAEHDFARKEKENEFEVSADTPALSNYKKFVEWQPKTSDKESPKYKAIRIYQDLLKFHMEDGNTDALLDCDISRLNYIKNISYSESKDKLERYKNRLKEIMDDYPDYPGYSLAAYHLAKFYMNKKEFVKAYEIAQQGYRAFPNSFGGQHCYALMSRIKQKDLIIRCESYVPEGKFKILVRYKNFNKLYFRIYKDEWKEFMGKEYGYPNSFDRNKLRKLLATSPYKEWSVELPETKDYKYKKIEVEVPQLEKGYYRIFASWQPRFINSSHLQQTYFWVTNLTLVTRRREGEYSGFVYHAKEGVPCENANVFLIARKERYYKMVSKYFTDKNGFFRIPYSDVRRYYDKILFVKKGDDMFLDPQTFYVNRKYSRLGYSTQAVIFTDRAIYRPGQTIHFKGICLRVDTQQNNYKVVPNYPLTVVLKDVNYQKVSELKVVTNEFGSFSGSFTAPKGRLTGRMQIVPYGVSGFTTIRVEEYKRPKFKVVLEKPLKPGKLGELIEILGKAVTYSGAPVDFAKVRFRVVRQGKFPPWCFWFFRNTISSPAREIAHGRIKTDSKGKFIVKFKAVPDKKYSEKYDPTFTYKIMVDVTDSTGETRSARTNVVLGYRTLKLTLNVQEPLFSGKEFGINIKSSTLNNVPEGTNGVIRIYKLKEPDKPYRKSYWNRSNIEGLNDPFVKAWQLWPVETKVVEKEFSTIKENPLNIRLSLGSGLYKVVCEAKDTNKKPIKAIQPLMILPSADTKKFSIKLPFVAYQKKSVVEVGDTAEFYIGTGYNSGHFYIELEEYKGITRRIFTPKDNTYTVFKVPVTEDMRGGFAVHIIFVKENRAYIRDFNVDVPWDNKDLELSFHTFHSKLLPGQSDTWVIQVKGKKAKIKAAEMVATLYDASLDMFCKHDYRKWSIFRRFYSSERNRFVNSARRLGVWSNTWNRYVKVPSRTCIQFPSEIITNFAGFMYLDYGFKARAEFKGRLRSAPQGFARVKRKARKAKAMEDVVEKEKLEEADAAGAPPKKNGKESQETGEEIDLSKVKIRKNLNETAFFYPHLIMDEDGIVKIQFKMPEALTTWKFLGFAHGKGCESGVIRAETITQKKLMVSPNPPRFLREGDLIEFTAKVINLSEKDLKGKIKLTFLSLIDEENLNNFLGLKNSTQTFFIPRGQSKGFSFKIKVPYGTPPLIYRVVAGTSQFSDGEEGSIPVLSNRIMVTESLPLWVRGKSTREFNFKKLKENLKSKTLSPIRFVVQMTSNPAWYAIQALPYLMEYPYECSEQIFNRFYANSLAQYIANSNPRIRRIFDSWKGTDELKSNLEKNQKLKSVLLEETPWVIAAKNETQAKKNVGLLFEENTMRRNLNSAYFKLKKMQLYNGAWSWFPGGRPNPFITLYIVTGFGRLRHLGVKCRMDLGLRGVNYIDRWIKETYDRILHKSRNNLSSIIALYIYGRSFYLEEKPIPSFAKEAVDYFLNQAVKYWLKLPSRMSQGHLALGLKRFGYMRTAKDIMISIRERSVSDEELGMYWRDLERSWWWYRAPIETQAVMIEAFDEVLNDKVAVEECKVWLLKQKQTQAFKTTKATADAIYALLLRGTDLLASNKIVKVELGGELVPTQGVTPGTGFYEKVYTPDKIKPSFADIKVIKEDEGIAWGGVHFQYLEDISKITSHTTKNISLKKKLFIKKNTPAGPTISPITGAINVGDLIIVRIELKVDRDMEFVHMKDYRGSGLEPVNVLSRYKFQDGLYYYESTKDTATHFFIDYLPKGTYVFEYPLRVQLKGKYQSGIAQIQCMYAPEFNSHSNSVQISVK